MRATALVISAPITGSVLVVLLGYLNDRDKVTGDKG